MERIGYVVSYGIDLKMYTYNHSLAFKFAKQMNGKVKKVSSENTNKPLLILSHQKFYARIYYPVYGKNVINYQPSSTHLQS